ncbi:MAG: hypothetical protein IN808_06350 [Rubrobacter sp.]|nr:hypothetical protein [Rubrobacter sp.]
MTEDVFESVAGRYERAAGELERAAEHLRATAARFRDRDVPRGCAQALAAQGRLRSAQRLLDELAVLHASRAAPDL